MLSELTWCSSWRRIRCYRSRKMSSWKWSRWIAAVVRISMITRERHWSSSSSHSFSKKKMKFCSIFCQIVKLVKVFVLLLFVYFWNFQRSKINKSWKYSQYTTKVVWKGKMKLPFVKIFKRCSRDEMAYLSSWEWQMHIFEINIM